MQQGYTVVMGTLCARYSANIVGLYDTSKCTLHEFDQCTLAGQPKWLLTVGRARHSDIKLQDPTVSLIHCEIVRRPDDSYLLRDAESTNGTFVNQIKIESVVLTPGMWIFVGQTEMVVIGEDRRIPITARTNSSFLRNAARYYGSDRKAADQVGKSAATICRARKSTSG